MLYLFFFIHFFILKQTRRFDLGIPFGRVAVAVLVCVVAVVVVLPIVAVVVALCGGDGARLYSAFIQSALQC